MNPPSFGAEDYIALLPPILMVLFGCATLLLDVASRHDEKRRWLVLFNLTGLLLTGVAYVRQWQFIARSGQTHMAALQGAVTIDGLSLFTNALVWLAALGLVLMSYRYMETADEHCGEYYALALFAQAGMYFMASSTDLIALFIGLELAAISFYILVGFTRADRRSNEASLKYLLLGALSSAFLLYGFSLFYGLSGSTQLSDIAVGANESSLAPFFVLGVITVTVGLLFKISAAPFHAWAPDAYDGAPTPVTAYLSVASKIASFAVLIRVLYVALPAARPVWEPIVIAAAVLSLTIGSIAALTQERLKRLFAYSAIAHAGYVLLGFVPGTQLGLQGIYVYLLVYAVMTLGAFAVMTSLRRHGIAGEEISDLRGLAQTHPLQRCAVRHPAAVACRHASDRRFLGQVFYLRCFGSNEPFRAGGNRCGLRCSQPVFLLPARARNVSP